MVTVQIEYTFEDYEVEDYLNDNGLDGEDIEDHLDDFVLDRIGIHSDSVRVL